MSCTASYCPSAYHDPESFANDGACVLDMCVYKCFAEGGPPSDPSYETLKASLRAPLCDGSRDYLPLLEFNDWDSNKLTNNVARILLDEILGFQVRPVATSGGAEVFSRIGFGYTDLNFEVWAPTSKLTMAVSAGLSNPDLITYRDNGVQSSGSTYFMMDTSGVVESRPELFNPAVSWNDPDLLSLLTPDGTVPDHKMRIDPLDPSSPYICDGAAWGGASVCMYGKYVPPQCLPLDANGVSNNCKEILAYKPSWASGWYESLVLNQGYNFTFAYVDRDNLQQIVTDRLVEKTAPAIFYAWQPDGFATKAQSTPIEFPPYTPECEASFRQEPTLSGVTCGKEKGVLAKGARAAVLEQEPDLKYFYDAFQLSINDVKSMMSTTPEGSIDGKNTKHDAACEWARANVDVWKDWIKQDVYECPVIKTGVDPVVVASIVVSAVVMFLILFAVHQTKEKKMMKEKLEAMLEIEDQKSKGTVLTRENDKLKNDVAIMQDYNNEEIAMLEDQIKKFTQDMSATDGVHKDMARLLIKADELVGKVVIGAGAYGEVYKSDYRGTAVAVKTMKQVDEETLERFQGEIMLMSGLRHQNVVTMVGCCWEKDLMALVMEFCEKGTSADVLKAEGDQLAWDDPLLKWLLDVSRGMSYLHGMTYYDADKNEQVKGIIHRDLKPDNCLVTETWGVKIADFGEARAALENATMTQVGTPIYISPEVVKGEHYTGQADVFSFAMTILQFCLKKKLMLAFLKEEYKAYKKREPTLGRVSHEVCIKGWRPDIEKIEGVPRSVVDLLGMCWGDNPDARPTFGEIVDYARVEVQNEVMGAVGGGTTGRRTSTSGELAIRIKIAKAKKEAEKAEERATRLLNLDAWSKEELIEGFLKQKKELEAMYAAETLKPQEDRGGGGVRS